jgi:hypothetical protein
MSRLFVVKPHQTKHHWFFDSDLFSELQRSHDVSIIKENGTSATVGLNGSPLSEIIEGGPSSMSRLESLSWKIISAARFLGPTFKNRKRPFIGSLWSAMLDYADVDNWSPRTRFSKLMVATLALLASRKSIFGLARSVLARTTFRGRIKRLQNEFESRDVLVTFGGTSFLEVMSDFAARGAGVQTLWLPMTPDIVIYDGYHLGNRSLVCSWGPWITEALGDFHGLTGEVIVESGNLMSRYQEQLLNKAGQTKFQDILGIDNDSKIITYFAVDNSSSNNSERILETLIGLVHELGDGYILVVREAPKPCEPSEPEATDSIENVIFRSPDMNQWIEAPEEFWLEHALSLRDSELVVFGTFTSGIYQAAVWGTPIVINAIDQSGVSTPLSPSQCINDNVGGLAEAGVVYASTYDELAEVSREAVLNPSEARSKSAVIGELWDYSESEYIEFVLDAVRAASGTGGGGETISEERP